MKPRDLFRTTAAILVLGLASVAGSQPNQQAPDAGSTKQQGKPDHAKGQDQGKGQRQPAQAAKPQQAHAQGQARGQAQGQARGQAQGRTQVQAQGRAQRPAGQVARGQSAASNPQRRTQVQYPAQRSMVQGGRTQGQGSRQASGAPMRNRLTPAPRQVVAVQAPTHVASSRVEQQAVWPRYRAQSWNTEHRTWVQRGGYSGYRIPSASFGIYFGRPHRFHLSSYQIRVVGAYPEFYADGFWFTMLDPVPEYWSSDWYDTEYVTIIQSEDGYYLLDESHPDAMLAISVQIG